MKLYLSFTQKKDIFKTSYIYLNHERSRPAKFTLSKVKSE